MTNYPVLSQTFIVLQLVELKKLGFLVSVYNLGTKGRIDWFPEEIRKVLDTIPVFHRIDGIRSSFSVWRMIVLFFSHPIAYLRLRIKRRRIRRSDYLEILNDAYFMRKTGLVDLIHCQFATATPIIISMKKYGFLSLNHLCALSVRGYDLTKTCYRFGLDWGEIMNAFKLFLPVCDEFVRILKELGCCVSIAVVRSPIDLELIQKTRRDIFVDEKLRFISVGRLVEKKGIDLALHAIALLKADGVDFTYDIIGDGVLKDHLLNLVDEYNLTENVRFLGSLKAAETINAMANCNVLLCPSKTAKDGDSEGIPNVAKEAMALGLQVIASRHSGLPELITNELNGYLFDENDYMGLLDQIRFVDANRSDWKKVSSRAIVSVETNYNIKNTTNQLLHAYDRVFGINK